VATASFSAPWGIMLAAKGIYATSTPHTADGSCLQPPSTFPSGAPCRPVSYTLGSAGYRSLDLQVTKNFELGDLGSIYIRLDGINLTNEQNFVDFTDLNGTDGTVIGGRYNRDGNITGLTRTLRMSFGVKF
jgi:hypothetical protein